MCFRHDSLHLQESLEESVAVTHLIPRVQMKKLRHRGAKLLAQQSVFTICSAIS
jgi:hypothetical protein